MVILSFVLSCSKAKVEFHTTPYSIEIPSHFPKMIIPNDNPMTVEGIELGRKLFYETLLSGDNSMSCASCHTPESSFSDTNQYSTGITGTKGNRNSMPLVNLGWQKFFFWDGRASTLEEQIIQPVINPIEMHETWKNGLNKIKGKTEYQNGFFNAFQSSKIDSLNAAKAIAQFLRTLISSESKFDIMYKSIYNLTLSNEEKSILQTVTQDEWGGYYLFNSMDGADCFHCHSGPLLRIEGFSNNGLDFIFNDLGRGAITNNPNDNGKFKIPTLRNIGFTAPYMHDGRFKTLDEVIDHYSSGIHQSSTLDPNMEFAYQGGIQLNNSQKKMLKAFLLTMNDFKFINNPNFKKP